MRTLLLAAAASVAAILVPAAPAEAEHDAQSSRFSGQPVAHGDRDWRDGDRRHDRRDRRRHGDFDEVFVVGAGGFAAGDRAWKADSYNDWWHDRPDRAYPAWVRNNRNCERIWWSGGGWRC